MPSVLANIIGKELKDGLRDKRALMTLFFSPVLFLILMYGLVLFLLAMQKKAEEFILPVQGAEFAQPLMSWFREEGITPVPVEGDAAQLVTEREQEFVLVIPADFPESFREFDDAPMELIYDRSRNDIQGKINRVKVAIQQWSGRIGSLRLVARGVSPRLANPIRLEEVDVADDQKLASRLFIFVPLMLVMIIFTSSIGLSVDMMAGEREKNSLEPLLLNPVSREIILAGKWLAAVLCTFVVLVLTAFALYLLIPTLPLEQLGLQYQINVSQLLGTVLIAIPLIFFATVLQLLVSIFAKSFKEAQSYISLLIMVPLFIAYYVLFTDVNQAWQVWVPILGPLTIMETIFIGETVDVLSWFAAVSTSLLLAALAGAIVASQLRREKIIYG